LFLAVKWLFLSLVAINKLCSTGTSSVNLTLPTIKFEPPAVEAQSKQSQPFTWRTLLFTLSKPLRRFTLLWCILLLLTTHPLMLKIALAIVVIHIGFALFAVFRVTVFSAGVLSNLEVNIRASTESLLSKILFVTSETEATPDLRNTWTSIAGIRTGLLFLQNGQLVSRWVVVLGSAFLGCVYIYLALLFSFAYYGIARVQSVALTWPDSFVTSLFIPFAFGDLPRNVWLKLVGGIHCTTILAVGTGTIINYVTRKAEELRKVAIGLNERFADEEVRARLLILEEKFKPPAVPGTP
jgi:hypothetical protein